SFPRLCCRVARPAAVHPFPAVRVVLTSRLGVSGGEGRGKGENEPRRKSRLVLVTHWASHSPGPPFGYSFPFVSSSVKRAHIPLLRGGAPVGLSEVVGSEVEGRGGDDGDGGGGGVKRE